MRLKVIRFLRLHFIIAIQFLIIFSAKGVGGAQKRGGRYTAMAKKMDLGALRQQILELQIDKELKHDLLEVINEKKHYGLVWEESSEAAWDDMQDQLPVFVEDESKRLKSAPEGSPNHLLIEGDNLNALAALTYAYAGKIDVIYIDPPYNTGNKDFIYNDSFVDKEDGYRHSKWLSFMNRRLKIAKKLLSEKGVIFISIDDNEQADLKLLCDEIFGEENYFANLLWQSTPGSNTGKDVKTVTEYILMYSKQKTMVDINSKPIEDKKKYKFHDEHLAHRGPYITNKLDRRMTGSHYSEALNYPIDMPDGTILYPGCSSEKQEHWNWRWSKQKVEWGIANDFIVFNEKNGKWAVYFKQYLKVDNNDTPIERALPYQNLILEDAMNSARGTKEVMDIFSEKKFDYPKPLNLIVFVLNMVSKSDSTILDFFAGSGTTLHATMQLNSEDGGHRKCILVTNNENNICEKVTYERNKRVINGYTNQKGEEVPGLTHNNLRYYKTEFVPRDQSSSKSRRALMASLVDLLCIKNNIYQEQETFVGKKFKKSVLRYFKDEAGQMLVVLDERVVSIVIPMIAEVATKQNPLKVYVYSDGAYAYEDEFHKVMPVIELCAMPDAFLQALEGRTDILPKRKYSDAMMSEFQQNEELAMHDEEVVKEALSDDYDYVPKEKEDNVTNDIID